MVRDREDGDPAGGGAAAEGEEEEDRWSAIAIGVGRTHVVALSVRCRLAVRRDAAAPFPARAWHSAEARPRPILAAPERHH